MNMVISWLEMITRWIICIKLNVILHTLIDATLICYSSRNLNKKPSGQNHVRSIVFKCHRSLAQLKFMFSAFQQLELYGYF